MSARTKKVGELLSGLLRAFVGGAVLLIMSLLITVGHDDSQEATVGIISRHGLPIPFAFMASGYSHLDFSSTAALADYLIWAALVFVVFRFLRKHETTT